MTGTGKHRLRDDPYPDELDQQFCEEDETLCSPGRPCMCCWVEQQEAAEESAAVVQDTPAAKIRGKT